MLLFAFIKLLFAAVLFLGIAALGMMAFRAIRRRGGFYPYSDDSRQTRGFALTESSPLIVLGQPMRRPVTLTMRQRTIEVR